MNALGRRLLTVWFTTAVLAAAAPPSPRPSTPEELLVAESLAGRRGGKLVASLRGEPKTLNPVTSTDSGSRDIIWRIMGDLVAIARDTQRTGPALAKSWTISPDGKRYTLELRRGLRFSDGHPFDADDVVFTFEAYLDERNNSPQRDLLVVGGKPITARKVDSHTVVFELEQTYAVAERLFDGVAILPRHLLQKAQQEGRLGQAWGVTTPPAEIAGLGPFRLKSYVPGDRAVLERNPHYWKADRAGNRLPYLDEVTFLFLASEDAQVIRFQAGDTDLISRFSAENFAVLAKDQQARGYRLQDLGPGLEYAFVFFNLNDDAAAKGLAAVAPKQAWFRKLGFRQAVSSALDREGMVRLVYQGRAVPLAGHVTPGNKLWLNRNLPPPRRSLARARELLQASGFSWKADGALVDSEGQAVEFSIITNAGNTARVKMATIIQDDLRQLGMSVHVVPLEFRAFLDRVMQTHDYEACVLSLAGGDADPNVEINIWLSGSSMHLWNPGQKQPATPWEAEIDRLMRLQLTTMDPKQRKALFDRVQALVAENLPLIPLVSPNALVGAKADLLNLRPAILDHVILWNVEELAWRQKP